MQRVAQPRAGHAAEGLIDLSRAQLIAAVASACITVPYLLTGPGLVMDDWWSLRNVRFEGALSAAGPQQWQARPGAGVIYAVIFPLFGEHPVAYVLLLAVLNIVTAVLILRLLSRFFSVRASLVAALVWVVMPSHMSVEVWGSTTNIAVSQVLTVASLLLLSAEAPRRAALLAAGLMALVAALSYEACIPVLVVGALAIALHRSIRSPSGGDPRRSNAATAKHAGFVVVPALAAVGWILTHYHPAKGVSREVVDISQVVPANLGWGIFPSGLVESVGLISGCVVLVIAALRVGLPSFRTRARQADWLAASGLVLMFVGTTPFLFYLYQPLGGGDRVNYLSAIGGAMVWAGGFEMLWEMGSAIAIVGAVVFVGFVIPVRMENWQLWHRAGIDAAAVPQQIKAAIPEPAGEIVVGPKPIVVKNIAAFPEPAALEAAVQMALDDPSVKVRFATSEEDFTATPAERRFDNRPGSRLLHP